MPKIKRLESEELMEESENMSEVRLVRQMKMGLSEEIVISELKEEIHHKVFSLDAVDLYEKSGGQMFLVIRAFILLSDDLEDKFGPDLSIRFGENWRK